MFERKTIGGHACYFHEDHTAKNVLLQPVDDHDLSFLDSEFSLIRQSSAEPFLLAAFQVERWNHDLSPWEAPAIFGPDGFGDGAEKTLHFVLDDLIPQIGEDRHYILGGYSLAAFFSLWAAYQTDRFRGIAAASPSVWFPGWVSFISEHEIRSPVVYLSLGNKEAKTRNKTMATVEDRIRQMHTRLEEDKGCASCTLEWNQGNHFKEPDVRTAKGFAWVLSECGKSSNVGNNNPEDKGQ